MTRTKMCRISRVLPVLALLGLILVAPGTLRAQTPRVPIYPTLAANPDLVLGGPPMIPSSPAPPTGARRSAARPTAASFSRWETNTASDSTAR
jgi:hypothetical protein